MTNSVGQGGPGPSSNPGGPGRVLIRAVRKTRHPRGRATTLPIRRTKLLRMGPGRRTRRKAPAGSGNQAGSTNGNGQSFGGLPIVGVASTSKNKSIREFNKKDHYNQWQFIYDPSTDRGGLLTTPNQPPLQNAVQVQEQPGQQNNNGQNQPGFSPGPGGMNPGMQQPPPQPDQQQPNQQ